MWLRVQTYRVSKQSMWALITEIPLATAWPKINGAHKRKMPKRNFVLEMVYAAWARARRNPYIENPSICSILRNYSCETSANVQWEQRAFQVRVAVAMREDSSVHNGWHATSQTKLVDCHLSSSILCSQLPSSQTAQTWDSLLFYTQNACQLPGAASQRTAHNSHCLLNLSLFQISYEHYHVIKFLGHLKTLSFRVLLYIYSSPYLSKDKEVEWRKSVFYYLFNLVKSKRKAYQEKKRLWLLYGAL